MIFLLPAFRRFRTSAMQFCMNTLSKFVLCCLGMGFALASLASGGAAVITQWNFNVNSPGTNNSPVPSTGSGVAQMVGMNNDIHAGDFPNAFNANSASSDPAVTPAPDLSWRVRGNSTASSENGWSGTTQLLSGAQFSASTVGFTDITLSFDIQATDGSPRYAQLQYTLDGTNFSSFGPLFDFNLTNDLWANGLTRDLSSIPGADNNPNLGFKIVSAFSPVDFTDAGGFHAANTTFQRADADPTSGPYTGEAGNFRFDMVTFSGTAVPEPTSLALLAISACSIVISRRRRSN